MAPTVQNVVRPSCPLIGYSTHSASLSLVPQDRSVGKDINDDGRISSKCFQGFLRASGTVRYDTGVLRILRYVMVRYGTLKDA